MRASAFVLLFGLLTVRSALADPPSAPAGTAPKKPEKGAVAKKKSPTKKGATAKPAAPPPDPAPVPEPPPPPPPAPAASPDGVETIDLGSADGGVDAAPVPATEPDTFQVRGWARARASLQAGHGADVASTDPASLQVPNDIATGDTQLFLRLRYAHGRSFEAVVSGVLGYTLSAHDAYDPAAAKVSRTARGFYEADLREAYIGFFWDKFDLRIGQQRIAWGNSDGFSPNDVLNPRDLRDPVLVESDLARLPTLAIRGDTMLPFGDLELVFEPFFTPDRVDAYGTNWAFIQPGAPAAFRGLFSQLSSTVSPSLQGVLQPLLRQTALPADDLHGASVAARFNWSAGGIDVSHYYQYGYTYAPALQVSPALLGTLSATDWSVPNPTAVSTALAAVATGDLQSTYQRRHHVGSSAQVALSPFLLRMDAAYDTANVYSDTNLLGVVRPAFQGVLGAEYQTGEVGKNILIEGWYSHVFGGPLSTPLLGADIDSVAVSAALRWTFVEHLEVELRGVGGIRPLGVSARPQIAYKNGSWEIRGGYIWLDGESDSIQRYYRRNSAGYLVLRRLF